MLWPDVNWGSSTQAQTYRNALTAVQQLNKVQEHVKNYQPQILVLSALPSCRPPLVDFATLMTKKSLLVCGHILSVSSPIDVMIITERVIAYIILRTQNNLSIYTLNVYFFIYSNCLKIIIVFRNKCYFVFRIEWVVQNFCFVLH